MKREIMKFGKQKKDKGREKYETKGIRAEIMKQELKNRSSCYGTTETNLTRNHEVSGLIPGLTQ